MTTKSKTEPVESGAYATAEDMATVLETVADLSERLEQVERAQADADRRVASGRPGADDPVFMATTGRGSRVRESEGERQDKIVQANALRHLREPAGDGVVTGPITSSAVDLDRDPSMDDPDAPPPIEPAEGDPGVEVR